MTATVRLVLPVPVGEGCDYRAEAEAEAIPEPGAIVEAPFGARRLWGVAWGAGGGAVAESKLKPFLRVFEGPRLPEATRLFVERVARYTVTPPGLVLKMVLGGAFRPPVRGDDYAMPRPDPDHAAPVLSAAQEDAAAILREDVRARRFAATLLDGVTGSGKTEVYGEALAEAFRHGRQALVLLPEIAMTAALLDRFAARFGQPPVVWHSGLSERQRRLHWHAVARGEARFVLGARSALFLPYANLGAIVVDEEHEAAYKQEEGVVYHGRDMAVLRAQLEGIPIVLASATPSLETLHNVAQGKYRRVALAERYGRAAMPRLQTVDLRKDSLPAQHFISAPLLEALKETAARGQQSLLFLNRRGYAPLTLCRACGHRFQCPHCTGWLVEHRAARKLRCHRCDYAIPVPEACPDCGATDRFAACGPGVERIAEEVAKRLPELRAAVVASDTLETPEAAQALVESVREGRLDLLIGTQILAKGYHFPRLTLVGVVDADLGLEGGDPRAAERTFQLLQQVAGRSGRAEDAGRVLLQTTAPEHPVMQALLKGDRDSFMAREMAERAAWKLPPFARLAGVTVSGPDSAQVMEVARQLAAAAPRDPRIRLLGPAPAPFALLRGQTRHRLLVQAERAIALPEWVRGWLAPLKWPRRVRVQVDIDPYSFL